VSKVGCQQLSTLQMKCHGANQEYPETEDRRPRGAMLH
jgi:hypothetical protein